MVKLDEIDGQRTWVELGAKALLHNLAALRAGASAGALCFAVVKADAYGHGLSWVVSTLTGLVDGFAVANVAEARVVRMHASNLPILIMGPALDFEREEIVRSGFLPVISTMEEAAAYASFSLSEPVAVHLAIDTGMGRIGVWEREALNLARAVASMRGLKITGVGSHFPVADEDADYTRAQAKRFNTLVGELRQGGLVTGLGHIGNSAGVLGFPDACREMYRAGLALYGASPLPVYQKRLQPVLSWKTRISLVRELEPERSVSYGRTFVAKSHMRVATLAVGYADGYRRHLSGRGAWVLVGGRRCAVLGRVTMDQIMVDVSSCPEAVAGSEAVLLGVQGSEEITVATLADLAGTIPWDIFTGIGRRVSRLAVES